MTTKFKRGDVVQWTSQSQGVTTTKRGTVHQKVLVMHNPKHFIPKEAKPSHIKFDLRVAGFERYIIAVPRGGKSQIIDYYCPKPGLLQQVEEGDNQ
ncbi:hypothetical protein [Paenibacillus sabinae]|uniref:DUF2945 domain-containing protein n=1 Tax=Paenibacillus sabinae T27 TaxID=1268072 RepID=X4ZUZ6_9BACL|nr:hypothetical protein [Paenibacillus sabinae]AHV96138.1 hypothetical protein PSAB_06010 [Paenibacillus sabinae T27]